MPHTSIGVPSDSSLRWTKHGATSADLTADGRQIHRLTGNRKGAYAVAIFGREA